MKKLKLNLSELKVETFSINENKENKGTVNGQERPSKLEMTCDNTECGQYSCNATCLESCNGTCDSCIDSCLPTCNMSCNGTCNTCHPRNCPTHGELTCADYCGLTSGFHCSLEPRYCP